MSNSQIPAHSSTIPEIILLHVLYSTIYCVVMDLSGNHHFEAVQIDKLTSDLRLNVHHSCCRYERLT